jgi:hypothetical protein
MDDVIFNIRQLMRYLDIARSSLHSIWRDNAERQISSRYVDPLLDAAHQIETNSEQLHYALSTALRFLETAKENSKDALEISQQIAKLLAEIESELQIVTSGIQSIISGLQSLDAKCKEITELLRQANEVGNSAPPRKSTGLALDFPIDFSGLVYGIVDKASQVAGHTVNTAVDVAHFTVDTVLPSTHNN